jgi:hypothetical protein
MFSGIKTPKELEISPLLSLNKNQSTCLGLPKAPAPFVEVPTRVATVNSLKKQSRAY